MDREKEKDRLSDRHRKPDIERPSVQFRQTIEEVRHSMIVTKFESFKQNRRGNIRPAVVPFKATARYLLS